jgi:hypothetical protein
MNAGNIGFRISMKLLKTVRSFVIMIIFIYLGLIYLSIISLVEHRMRFYLQCGEITCYVVS